MLSHYSTFFFFLVLLFFVFLFLELKIVVLHNIFVENSNRIVFERLIMFIEYYITQLPLLFTSL